MRSALSSARARPRTDQSTAPAATCVPSCDQDLALRLGIHALEDAQEHRAAAGDERPARDRVAAWPSRTRRRTLRW